MQTEYQHSDHQQNQSQYLTPVHSVATSELSPALEMGSKVAMILVLLGTIFGSLEASRNAPTVSEAETIESVPTTPIEESPVVVEPVEPLNSSSQTETTSTTPTEPVATTSSLESTVETASPTTETTESALSSTPTTPTTQTTDSEASAVDLTQPETTTTTDTTDSEISTSSEIPETTATTDPTLSDSEVASDTTDATASVSVEETTTDTTATPDMTGSTAETQTASKTISATEIEKLNQILYDKIDKTWTVPVNGESVYTVQVTQDGSITAYKPKSQVATNNANNTPLPSLVQSNGSSETLAKEPYAEFEVIFTPTGLLEVKNSNQSDSN